MLLPVLYTLSLVPSEFDLHWFIPSICMSLATIPIWLCRSVLFRSDLMLWLIGFSYPLQMVFLICIRTLHIIPPYLFD
ncbi:MAG: hypothetical protein IJ242_11730 [Clostridia bacterium]|nr:hypothetical protein [Clostridia bacterium]